MEAEYIVLSQAIKDVIPTRMLITEVLLNFDVSLENVLPTLQSLKITMVL